MVTVSPYILAIDQGTTSTRAILFDGAGRARSTAQIELTQYYPQPGWVEHDPDEIWRSVVAACPEAAAAADGPIAAIGITNQRETVVLWEKKTGRAICNALVWQDTRVDGLVTDFAKNGGIDRFRRKRPGRPIPPPQGRDRPGQGILQPAPLLPGPPQAGPDGVPQGSRARQPAQGQARSRRQFRFLPRSPAHDVRQAICRSCRSSLRHGPREIRLILRFR